MLLARRGTATHEVMVPLNALADARAVLHQGYGRMNRSIAPTRPATVTV